jgi:hypothetical protein
MMSRLRTVSIAFAMAVAGCTSGVIPTMPTETPLTVIAVPVPPAASRLMLEGESGSGDGDIRQRSQASGGRTVHLGPGERRSWSFSVDSLTAQYALAVRYSNGRYGPNESITLIVDGQQTGSFQDRNTGEDTPEGWNAFVDDEGGLSMLPAGNHTVTLAVTGGDGCVEIDVVTLSPRD